MEAALLMFDVIGITLVLIWAARGRGTEGLFAWRPDGAGPLRRKPAGSPKAPRRD